MAQPLPCPTWLWSNNSNVHAAKDRSWFSADYTPFNSAVGSLTGGDPLQVVGIGTVELPVKRSPTATGPGSHGILRLPNVLHIPTLICNVIGNPITDEYAVSTGPPSPDHNGTITDDEGGPVAYFNPDAQLFEVVLSSPPIGPRVGPSPLKPSGRYYINVRWPDSERERWESSHASVASGAGPLSEEEKEWLNKHYQGEYRFLASHGLSIYKEEDREEGRGILRALMTEESDDDKSVPPTGPRDYYPPDHPSRRGR